MGAMTGLNFLAADNRVAASVSIVPIINPLWGNKDPAEKIKVVQHPHLCIYSTGPTRAVEQAVCDNGRGNVTKKSLEGGHELENVREQAAEEILDFFLEQFDEHR